MNNMELARAQAREILSNNMAFRNLPIEEQKRMYQEVVREQAQHIARDGELSTGQNVSRRGTRNAPNKGKLPVRRGASALIDDTRHEKGFEEGVDAFEDLVESVDFPKFVRDLLEAVFQANMEVMKSQTDDYIRLMKEASTGLSSFIKQIDDTTTFAYLAERQSDEFGLDTEEDEDGEETMVLTDRHGEKVDVEDSAIKTKIMDAKIKMAQEHRAALREMILMGVTRLVVEKGEVEAEVNFEFKGTREVNKKDKAIKKRGVSTSETTKANLKAPLGGLFGGPSVSYGKTKSTRRTQLSVSSAKSKSTDELSAKLRGYVNIKFKTDYFKLDNFAQMYTPPSKEEQQAAIGPPKPGGVA